MPKLPIDVKKRLNEFIDRLDKTGHTASLGFTSDLDGFIATELQLAYERGVEAERKLIGGI